MLTKHIDYLTIGSIKSRRVKYWRDAVGTEPGHRIISYHQVIDGDLPHITKSTYLRITSPGEDFEVKKNSLH